jgi:hypothetical protein
MFAFAGSRQAHGTGQRKQSQHFAGRPSARAWDITKQQARRGRKFAAKKLNFFTLFLIEPDFLENYSDL